MNRAPFLRQVFLTALVLEVGGLLLLLGLGIGGFAVVFYIFPVLVGLVGAALGSLAKPRSRLALAALAFNLLCVGYYFTGRSIESALQARRDRAFDRKQQATQELAQARAQQRDEFFRLFQDGRVRAAKDFLDDHDGLELSDETWLARLFCGLGTRTPDRDLLVRLRDYAQLRDGDLVAAAASCSRELTKRVLDMRFGACAMTASGNKPQMRATDLPSLELLFERGCALEARSRQGATALMFHRSPEVTRYLLKRGARVDAVDVDGRSALFYCGPEDALAPCLELLLQAGADPSLRAKDGVDRPLISQARTCKNQRAADVLVAHGADPEARDQYGNSATMYAVGDRDRLVASLRWPGLHLEGVHGADLLREAMAIEAWDQAALLLDAGANPNVASGDERTALKRMEYIGFNGYSSDNPKYAALVRFAARLGLHPP